LRQSSERQVKENTESQRLQYALAGRARALGWQEGETIDTDLGRSAAIGAAPREGFERLIAAVARGEVGIVLGRDVSRRARTDKDWCHLLEVCPIVGTLIGDAEQSSDLDLMDDQLVRGIKATLSIVERKVLKLRLLQGMEEKARRGELKRLLPVGDRAGWDGPGGEGSGSAGAGGGRAGLPEVSRAGQRPPDVSVVSHPRGRATSEHEPRRVAWQLPTNSFLQTRLRNPAYAGAYVWGRREPVMAREHGKLRKRQGRLRRAEQCRVSLRDHHAGYMPWERFEEHLQILRDNNVKGARDESVGPVRAGQGLLAGLLRCGRCGRKLHVRYWGKRGTAARYLCQGALGGGGDYCQGFGGRLVDERFGQALLAVLSPLGLRASLAAADRVRARDQAQRHALVRQLEQCAYETQRAFEQYHAVDPRHRLVAAELERRWNATLGEREHLRAALAEMDGAAQVLGERERERILALGARFREVWASAHCPVALKKRLLRAVVEEVIVTKEEAGVLRFVIHWKGGSHTQFDLARPLSGPAQRTAPEDVDSIRHLAVRYGDDAIALVLNKLGRRTGKAKRWNAEPASAPPAAPTPSRATPGPYRTPRSSRWGERPRTAG
jgi:DNA invertase Pin-like site-specific DNA recombinase